MRPTTPCYGNLFSILAIYIDIFERRDWLLFWSHVVVVSLNPPFRVPYHPPPFPKRARSTYTSRPICLFSPSSLDERMALLPQRYFVRRWRSFCAVFSFHIMPRRFAFSQPSELTHLIALLLFAFFLLVFSHNSEQYSRYPAAVYSQCALVLPML